MKNRRANSSWYMHYKKRAQAAVNIEKLALYKQLKWCRILKMAGWEAVLVALWLEIHLLSHRNMMLNKSIFGSAVLCGLWWLTKCHNNWGNKLKSKHQIKFNKQNSTKIQFHNSVVRIIWPSLLYLQCTLKLEELHSHCKSELCGLERGKLLIDVDSVENLCSFCSTLRQSSSQVLHADLAAADAWKELACL